MKKLKTFYTLSSPPKFHISSLSITCWPCNPQVLTYNHIRAFSTFVILVLFNWSIVLWKSSISKSEFCLSWPSYPSKIANSNATTNGISERSIPWRISKNRRTTLSFGCNYDFSMNYGSPQMNIHIFDAHCLLRIQYEYTVYNLLCITYLNLM